MFYALTVTTFILVTSLMSMCGNHQDEKILQWRRTLSSSSNPIRILEDRIFEDMLTSYRIMMMLFYEIGYHTGYGSYLSNSFLLTQ